MTSVNVTRKDIPKEVSYTNIWLQRTWQIEHFWPESCLSGAARKIKTVVSCSKKIDLYRIRGNWIIQTGIILKHWHKCWWTWEWELTTVSTWTRITLMLTMIRWHWAAGWYHHWSPDWIVRLVWSVHWLNSHTDLKGYVLDNNTDVRVGWLIRLT